MTLKEQTIKRIEQQKEKIEEHKKEYGRVSLFDKLELKYLESVLKDLEVLEILKRTQFQIYKLGFSNNYMLHLDTDHSIPITEEEANLISKVLKVITKEWMKNE